MSDLHNYGAYLEKTTSILRVCKILHYYDWMPAIIIIMVPHNIIILLELIIKFLHALSLHKQNVIDINKTGKMKGT